MSAQLTDAEYLRSNVSCMRELTPYHLRSKLVSGQLAMTSGRLAQLVRAFASHAKGRRFKSSTAHHVPLASLGYVASHLVGTAQLADGS